MDSVQWMTLTWFDSGTMLSLLAVLVLLLFSYLLMEGRSAGYPQGPLALPILGNIPQIFMCGTMDVFMEKYRRIYGHVYTIVTGGKQRIVVSGYDVFKELLLKNASITSVRNTDGRTAVHRAAAKAAPGLFFAPSPQWKTLRTVALHSLREDGMGRSALEPQIVEEIDHYITHFIKPNVPIDMTVSLAQATSNIISQFLFAKRFDYDDQKFSALISAINELVKLPVTLGIVSNIPFNKLLFRSLHQRDSYIRTKVLNPGILELIIEQREILDRENPCGLVAHYLLHAESEEEKSDPLNSDANGVAFIMQLYAAGTETTSTTLRFCLLYMCTQPDIQERVHKEIDEQIGDREVTYKDRLSMPYIEAVLLETARIANIVPTALPHTLEEDLVVEGKLIPGGSDLLLNMASVLHDQTVFDEPLTFRPERYLEGDIALKKQRTIPFSIGRRNCLGESLAKVEMFMFFVTFMQRYSVRLPEGSSADPSQVTIDIIRAPRPYKIVFTPR